MASLVFNTIKEPSNTVVIKWSRKGKQSISDIPTLLSAFSEYAVKVLSFIQKQGKAVLEFESIEQAIQFTNQCENGSIVFNTTLRFHPSYCRLVEPKVKNSPIQEPMNIEFDDISQILLKDNGTFTPELLHSTNQQILDQINGSISTNYTSLLLIPISADSPVSIFLEHHLYADEFALFAIVSDGKWRMTLPHENGINCYECSQDVFIVKGKSRFCRNFLISAESEGSVLVATNKRELACMCDYPDFCHDRLVQSSTLSKPTQMENEHVYEVYDKIAGHFSSTRYSQWNGVVDFLHSLPNYAVVMDMGCGNGKYLTYSHEDRRLYLLGCDRSIELLRICSGNHKDVSLMDGLFLSYRDECFDSVISIAVIHHLSTNALRRRFVINLLRVLKRGGRGLIVAWAMEKDSSGLDTKSNRGYAKADVMVQWQLQKEYNKEKKEGEVYQRYYHMFHQGELEWLLTTFDSIEIEKSWYERENWFVSFRKK